MVPTKPGRKSGGRRSTGFWNGDGRAPGLGPATPLTRVRISIAVEIDSSRSRGTCFLIESHSIAPRVDPALQPSLAGPQRFWYRPTYKDGATREAIVLPMEGLGAANKRIARLYSVPRSSVLGGGGRSARPIPRSTGVRSWSCLRWFPLTTGAFKSHVV